MTSATSRSPGGRLGDTLMIVTGGARGIGRATVEVAVREGARVVFFDTETETGRQTAIETATEFRRVDITDEDQVRAAVEAVEKEYGTVGVLVNNAGRNAYYDPVEMTQQEWDAVFAVDLKASWLMSKYVLPGMKAAGRGAIVNIASIHAHLTTTGFFPYAAAKSGVVGLTRSMALDLGPHGIRVNAVSPGYTRTRLVDEWLQMQEGDAEAAVIGAHPLRRIGTPAEIAEVVCFLASDAASFVTGADWAIDGGLSARFA